MKYKVHVSIESYDEEEDFYETETENDVGEFDTLGEAEMVMERMEAAAVQEGGD